jgi:hypothetical protein
VPTLSSFDYAVLRVVPRVDREEFMNAGVILFCLEQRFLHAEFHIDPNRLYALSPGLDLEVVKQHLEAVVRLCKGGAETGPIGELSQRERFHWLVAPRSTIIQTSAVHSGLCEAPELATQHLMEQLVFL